VPARHGVAVMPSQAEPGEQAAQVLRSAGTRMYCPNNEQDLALTTQASFREDPGGALAPSGHLVQLKEPGDSAYVSAGHGAHWVPPSDPWKDPGAQGKHWLENGLAVDVPAGQGVQALEEIAPVTLLDEPAGQGKQEPMED
jgi:hypothetical protein